MCVGKFKEKLATISYHVSIHDDLACFGLIRYLLLFHSSHLLSDSWTFGHLFRFEN